MKRIATPMIGGVITSAILELLIYPVTYGCGENARWLIIPGTLGRA